MKNPSLQNNDDSFCDVDTEMYEANEERLDKLRMSPPRLNCFICGTPMKTRLGRYGEFYYCPKGNHGTIGVNKYKSILKRYPQEQEFKSYPKDLLEIIDQECSKFFSITELESFYIDSPEYNPDDFWQDLRPNG